SSSSPTTTSWPPSFPGRLAIRDGRIVGDSSQKEIVHDDVYAPA
ncbi:hypothetical protein HMPREF0975_00503, partial [Actinomyces sp. oral taxon 849 str. F0330]